MGEEYLGYRQPLRKRNDGRHAKRKRENGKKEIPKTKKKDYGEINGLLSVLAKMNPEVLFQILEKIDSHIAAPQGPDEKIHAFSVELIGYKPTNEEIIRVLREGKHMNGAGWSIYLLRLWANDDLEEAKINYVELQSVNSH